MNANIVPPPLQGLETDDQESCSTERSHVLNPSDDACPGNEYKKMSIRQTLREKLAGDFQRLENVGIVDGLLKHPGRILYEIMSGDLGRTTWRLVGLLVVCMLTYGLVIGTFSGGEQLWVVPLKIVSGTLFSLLICLPSLYIFTSLSGGNQTFRQTLAMFAHTLALAGLLLAGFSPVVWIFAQSTNTVSCMGILLLVFWVVAIGIGMALLSSAFSFVNKRPIMFLKLWGLVFVVVVLQMTTTLRPLVGKFNGYQLEDKKFFVAHWSDSMNGTRREAGRR